jgi:hypothetical protein
MAIVVLVLWMFTAGAGFYVLVTSSLGRARPAASSAPVPQPASVPQPAPVTQPASVPQPAPVTQPASVPPPALVPRPAAVPRAPASSVTPSRRAARQAARRASRERWDPPSLVASKHAPILPSGRSLVEFAHPAAGITGLAFWLGFTLVHNRALGWIGFGLAAATACVGLGWFMANARAARRADPGPRGRSAPSFAGRLVALHGSAAALTVALAALTALVVRG